MERPTQQEAAAAVAHARTFPYWGNYSGALSPEAREWVDWAFERAPGHWSRASIIERIAAGFPLTPEMEGETT